MLEARGNVTSTSGSSYADVLNIAALPLPATLPPLFSELGVFGFNSRRRRA